MMPPETPAEIAAYIVRRLPLLALGLAGAWAWSALLWSVQP